MAGLSPGDYQRILDLAVTILDRGDTKLPWQLVADELRSAVPSATAVLFWSTGWVDAPPADFPLPYPRDLDDLLPDLTSRSMAAHPLVRHYQATADQSPRTVADLPDGGHWSDELARHVVGTVLGFRRHLALPLPAPPGEGHVILLGRPDEDFSDRDLEFAARLQPLLAGVVNQQRQLLRRPPRLTTPTDEYRLTPREVAVLTLLADTLTAEAIGRRLGISPRTVHKHLESLYRKMKTHDRLATVLRARSAGLLARSAGPERWSA
jgi:DNA-binding CsgD family transcriptional regulator